MTFFDAEGEPIVENGLAAVRRIDYSRPVPDGPVHRGFARFFGTVSCPTTDWLYAYMEGDRIPVPPTGLIDKSKLPDHFYALDCREGLIAPDFDLEQVDEVFLRKSRAVPEGACEGEPRSAVLSVSLLPGRSPAFVSGPGIPGQDGRGAAWRLHLPVRRGRRPPDGNARRTRVADRTLVIVTSDNGPELPTVSTCAKPTIMTAPALGAA
jgi:arylsulfatase A